MLFSHSFLKTFIPKLPPKKRLIEKLNIHIFEAEAGAGDMLDVSLPANRYSDASSYWGLARVIGAALKLPLRLPAVKKIKPQLKKNFPVIIEEPAFCRRMTARYIEGVTIKPSPKWLRDILKKHGLRPINNLVDITNYVMIETGQPTHVFDSDKMSGAKLIVRRARKGETLTTLDGVKIKLSDKDHVLADARNALDIAAVKGGTRAEVDKKTKNILLTAGSFAGRAVYETSRRVGVATDASLRFSHHLSPELALVGNERATALIRALGGGRTGALVDVYPKKVRPTVIRFDIDRFNSIVGVKITAARALSSLRRLGFQVTGNVVRVPLLRTDIAVFEDLVEEVANIYGYDNIKPQPPRIFVSPPKDEGVIRVREKARDLLVGFGYDELYNYSFVSKDDLEKTGGVKWWRAVPLENPISEKHNYLRPSLSINIVKNLYDNLRFFDTVRIFETGRSFTESKNGVLENQAFGIGVAAKKENPILELKGVVQELLRQSGLVHFTMSDPTFTLPYLKMKETLFIQSGAAIIGYLGVVRAESKYHLAIAEFDLEKLERLVLEEREYLPISKYPIITRDISLFVPGEMRIGDILVAMQRTAPALLRDVDLIDYYVPDEKRSREGDESAGADPERRKSLSFRLVFQAENRTLTDREVNREMKKINQVLEEKFEAAIR